MAQVYSFVDENGVTRLFAEIQPDPAGTPFNGGTIDNALIVDVDTGSNVTVIQAEANGVKINALADGGARATLQADASAPMLDLNAANVGDDLIDCSDGTARRFRVGSGGAILNAPASGADDSVFKAGDGSNALIVANGGTVTIVKLATAPAVSAASTLALGTAYQNTLGYDVLLCVYLSVTVNTSGVLKLGVGPTTTPTQQTLVTGITSTGLWPVPIYLPASYYALLSVTGTITVAVDGQIAMPV